MTPTTRKEAQRLGASHYFTGIPCKHGHVALRKTKGACVECVRIEAAESAKKRVEYFRAYNISEAGLAAKRRYYETNKAKVIERALTTPDAVKRVYRNAWKHRNPEEVKLHTNVRRRRHRAAIPPWVNATHRAEVKALYRAAVELTRLTGVRYVVDHIVPLQSDVVCGLHVPWNLRVTTQHENATKSNKLPDDSEAVAFPNGRCYNGPT